MDSWNLKIDITLLLLTIQTFGEHEELFVEDVGDGNLNDVVCVFTKDGQGKMDKSIIIKHSLPYIKCLGEAFPLGEQRIEVEYRALIKFHSLSPGSVPRPLGFDQQRNAVLMEHLYGYRILRNMLNAGEFEIKIVEKLGHQLAVVHRETHVATIGAENLHELDRQFENSMMCSLTDQYVFTRPFTKGDSTNRCTAEVAERLASVYGDQDILTAAQKMRAIFLEKKECLLHGDLHTGSIFIKDQDVKMFDMEFAFVGPAALDLGMFIANLIFNYFRHMSIEENNNEHRVFAYKMVDACKLFVSSYLDVMTSCLVDRDQYVANLMSETAGFCGCEIVRRLIGAAQVTDLKGMPLAEQDCLGAGVRLLKVYHRIQDIDRLLVIALMLAY